MVDKPAGMTSHDVVAVVRRLFGQKAVGHTGTLDPFATGLLILVLGRATRLARFVERGLKTYRGSATLGTRTTTDDPTGEPIGEVSTGPWPDRSAVEAAAATLVGAQAQRPPAFSAKQVGGRRSHRLARRGLLLDLAPVDVVVESIEVLGYEAPSVRFRATVGPGTYIRSLARDLGERLGTGAHLAELRRERVGRFDVSAAIPVDRLTGTEALIPPADLVADLRRVPLDEAGRAAVRHGRAVEAEPAAGEPLAALVDETTLVAIAEARNGRWHPIVVLETA